MKPTLLLLHGAIGSSDQLKPFSDLLSEDFKVYSFNFPGHGGDPVPASDFSIPFFADETLKFIKQRSLECVNIFGYSMGGYVALYLARHFPASVNKVMTLATKFAWDRETSEKESRLLIPEKIEEKIPEFARQLKERHAPQDWKFLLRKTALMMIDMGQQPPLSKADYAGIHVPVKLSVGDKVKMVSAEETKNTAGHIAGSSFCLFPDMPHPVEQVNPAVLCSEIRTFFLHSGVK